MHKTCTWLTLKCFTILLNYKNCLLWTKNLNVEKLSTIVDNGEFWHPCFHYFDVSVAEASCLGLFQVKATGFILLATSFFRSQCSPLPRDATSSIVHYFVHSFFPHEQFAKLRSNNLLNLISFCSKWGVRVFFFFEKMILNWHSTNILQCMCPKLGHDCKFGLIFLTFDRLF